MTGQIPDISTPEVYLNTFFPNARIVTLNGHDSLTWSLSPNGALPSIGYRKLSALSIADCYETYGFSGRFFHTEIGTVRRNTSAVAMRPANPAEIFGLVFATMRDLADEKVVEQLKLDARTEISEMSSAIGWMSLI